MDDCHSHQRAQYVGETEVNRAMPASDEKPSQSPLRTLHEDGKRPAQDRGRAASLIAQPEIDFDRGAHLCGLAVKLVGLESPPFDRVHGGPG